VYLLGDNLAGSIDSRSFGPVPATQLAGTVLAVVPEINVAIVIAGIALLTACAAGYTALRRARRPD
jgi:Signal peptidase, peptidase S26